MMLPSRKVLVPFLSALCLLLTACGPFSHERTRRAVGSTSTTTTSAPVLEVPPLPGEIRIGEDGQPAPAQPEAGTTPQDDLSSAALRGWLQVHQRPISALLEARRALPAALAGSGDRAAGACTALERATSSATSMAPAPEPSIEAAWRAAVAHYSTFAKLCVGATKPGASDSLATSAAAELQAGDSQLLIVSDAALRAQAHGLPG
jgi:hypothetical protein